MALSMTFRSVMIALASASIVLAADETIAQRMAATGSRCGDVVGAWSATVGGLRGRLVTSGSRSDRSALRVVLELQTVGRREPLELHWFGSVSVGFAAFRMDDPTGAMVPVPSFGVSGNGVGGALFELVPSHGTLEIEVASNLFANMMGRRLAQIAAVWSREMPANGDPRFLRARVVGSAPAVNDLLMDRTRGSSNVIWRAVRPSDPRGRAWIGTLDIPSVCID